MMIRYPRVTLAIVALLVLALPPLMACTQPNISQQVETKRAPASVMVVPNSGVMNTSFDFVGANFKPGEKVKVVIVVLPGAETVLGDKAEGLAQETDQLGSFVITQKLALGEGVFPVRVYDAKGEMIASTALQIVKKK